MGAEEIRYTAPPQSRNEAILAATIDGTQYTDPPQSRIEDLLLQVKEKIEQGGEPLPYDKDVIHADRQAIRDRINELQEIIDGMPDDPIEGGGK